MKRHNPRPKALSGFAVVIRWVLCLTFVLATTPLVLAQELSLSEEGEVRQVLDGAWTLTSGVTITLDSNDYTMVMPDSIGASRNPRDYLPSEPAALAATPAVDRSAVAARSLLNKDDIVRANVARRAVLERGDWKRTFPPREADLPAFRMEPVATTGRVSRGNAFPTGDLVGFDGAANRPDALALPDRLRSDAAVQILTQKKKGENVSLLIAMRPGQSFSTLPGERYGDLVRVDVPYASLEGLTAGELAKTQFIAYDYPLESSMVEVEAIIGSPAARSSTGASGAVGVCVIDTGLQYMNARFSANYVGGFDFVNNDSAPLDDNGHGTLMTDAIITVAPGAQIYAAKALDASGHGSTLDVIQAIDWCMLQNVTVISMSIAGGTFDSWCDDVSVLAQKANEAAARGFLVVAASGNSRVDGMGSPACGSLVTSVAASTKSDVVWSGSGFSNVTDLLAPGVNVTLSDGVVSHVVSGSSVSAAVVAGAGAVLAEPGGQTMAALTNRLRSTGDVLTGSLSTGETLSLARINLTRHLANQTNSLPAQQGWQSNHSADDGVAVQLRPCANIVGNACGGDEDCPKLCDDQAYCPDLHCGGSSLCDYTDYSYCDGTCSSWCDDVDGAACVNAPNGVGASGCSGNSCSGQAVVENVCEDGACGTGSTITTCSGNCDSVCSAGACQDTSAGADTYGVCSGGSASCSGQDVVDTSLCGAGTACGYTSSTCAGSCDSYCSGGSCQDSSAGADPYGICSAGASCSGQDVIDGDVCGSGASCGYTSSTCAGTCDSYCSSGSCQDTSAGTDPYNICADGLCTTGLCGSGVTCDYTAPGVEDGCSLCTACDGAGSCSNIAAYSTDTDGASQCTGSTGCENSQCVCDGSANCDINNGYNCGSGSQCVSNTCTTSVYNGTVTSARCTLDASSCVDSGGTVRASAYDDGNNVCYGSVAGGSVWLAKQGRWQINNRSGSALAIIDKYGSMGIRGTRATSQSSFDSGWMAKNKTDVTQASISSTGGNLKLRGTSTTRTTPSGTGVLIQNASGTVMGVFTSTGNLLLRGDFASSLTTLS